MKEKDDVERSAARKDNQCIRKLKQVGVKSQGRRRRRRGDVGTELCITKFVRNKKGGKESQESKNTMTTQK